MKHQEIKKLESKIEAIRTAMSVGDVTPQKYLEHSRELKKIEDELVNKCFDLQEEVNSLIKVLSEKFGYKY